MAERPTTSTAAEVADAGYFGVPVDQTPREDYTVAGQLKAHPIPVAPENPPVVKVDDSAKPARSAGRK